MTNAIISRGLQLLGHKKPKMSKRVESYRELGWEDLGPWEPGLEWDHNDGVCCPECGAVAVTSVLQTWENLDTDDYHYVDLLWCANRHMWVSEEGRALR